MTAKTNKLLNSTPLNASESNLTKSQLIQLKHEWRLKLKESGFEDIERWTNNDKCTPRIIKGHIRWKDYERKDFRVSSEETLEYFRTIETFVFYSEDISIRYKDVLIRYCITGNLTEACNSVIPVMKRQAVQSYIQTNFKKMLTFSNKFHTEPEDIVLGDTNEVH